MTFKKRLVSFLGEVLGWAMALIALAVALATIVLFVYTMSCGRSGGSADPL